MLDDVKKKVLAVFQKPQTLVSFATVDEGHKPCVRYMSMIIDQENLYVRSSTSLQSNKVKHISKQPQVYLLCGVEDIEKRPWTTVQIQGMATISTAVNEREKVWHEELMQFFKGIDDPDFGVIKVIPHKIAVSVCDNSVCQRFDWQAPKKGNTV